MVFKKLPNKYKDHSKIVISNSHWESNRIFFKFLHSLFCLVLIFAGFVWIWYNHTDLVAVFSGIFYIFIILKHLLNYLNETFKS